MTSEEDDARLIEAAMRHAPGSRRRLARRLLDVIHPEVSACLRRQAWAAGRDPRQDVLDLSQDVLVMLLEHDARELRRWDPERGRNLDNFVRLVARRRVARILDQRRGNPWADVPIDPQDIEDDPLADERAISVAHQLEQRNELGAVLDALYARMGERDLRLFDLLFVQECEPQEVASQLGMTRQAVNAWSYRTRKLARRLITNAGEIRASSKGPSSSREHRKHG